jgi:hypothetical protein
VISEGSRECQRFANDRSETTRRTADRSLDQPAARDLLDRELRCRSVAQPIMEWEAIVMRRAA